MKARVTGRKSGSREVYTGRLVLFAFYLEAVQGSSFLSRRGCGGEVKACYLFLKSGCVLEVRLSFVSWSCVGGQKVLMSSARVSRSCRASSSVPVGGCGVEVPFPFTPG